MTSMTEEYRAVFTGKALGDLQQVLTRYPTKQAALLPALWLVQRERGWISDRSMTEVAEVLGITPAYVKGVVTFYTMYHQHPVGKNFVQVCTTSPCNICGAEGVVKAFLEQGVRRPAHDLTVLERPRLRLVGVHAEVVRLLLLLRHERPLEPGGESGAAPPAQAGLLHDLHNLPRLYLQRLRQGLVPAAFHPTLVAARVGIAEVLRQDHRFLRMRFVWVAHG